MALPLRTIGELWYAAARDWIVRPDEGFPTVQQANSLRANECRMGTCGVPVYSDDDLLKRAY